MKAIARLALAASCVSILGGGASAVPATQEAGDTVTLVDGEVHSGVVKSEDHAGLTIEVDGKPKTLSWDKVQSVEYGDAPELSAALAALTAGRLDEALSGLQNIAAAEKPRPMVRQQVLFHLGWIAQRQDRLDDAIAAYQELLDGFPTGRYLRLAAENLVACQLAMEAPDAAAAALDKAAKAAGDAAPEVELVKAHMHDANGAWAEAKTIYEALQGSALASVAQEARLGFARHLIRDNKKSDAETLLRKVVSEPAPAHVMSGAWNGLGELYAEEGKARRDNEKLLDGLYSYLRSVVQYKPLLGEPTNEYERALAGAARCFRYLSELEQNAERKKLFAQRAQQHLLRLKNEYPQSIYLEDV